MKFKAAILTELRKPLTIAEIEMPKLEYGQVHVKILYSGICGSQINEILGAKGEDKYIPHLLGHEASAVVVECGPGVTQVKPGDHVVLHWRPGAGLQGLMPKYKWGDRTVNAGAVTTFSERAIVSENRMTKIPADFDMKAAPLYGCAIPTAYGIVQNDAKLKTGHSILILGSGGVGSAVAMMADLVSAYPIIAVDISDFKLEQAKLHGATHTINSLKEDMVKRVREILPKGVDVAVDTTGIKKLREEAFQLTSADGITVLAGVPVHGETMCIDSLQLHFDKRIKGSHGGDAQPAKDIPNLIRLQSTGRFELTKMITKEFSLDQINEALDAVRNGEVVRCIIKM